MTALHSFLAPPQPFTVNIPQAELDDLNARLDNARWPKTDVVPQDEQAQSKSYGLGYGPTLPLMKEFATEWRAFDWRAFETELNSFNHFKVEIEALNIHYIHHRSSRDDAIPLILCHGWPGSFHEFLHLIPLLTSPNSPTAQAFHVVIPSMPGFTFSSPPQTSTWKMDDTARVYDKLMTGLGYGAYAAQGGDWGSITARCLGALHGEHCKAVHLNFCPTSPSSLVLSLVNPRTLLSWLPRWAMSDLQRERASKAMDYLEKGSAYYVMQANTPRTPAYALNDSPIGLLAWIGEKMIPAIQATQDAQPTLTRKSLYETCSLYYLTGSIGTSFLPYALNPPFSSFLSSPKYRLPNFALSTFPREIVITPVEWVQKTGELKWNKEADDGGHYAALEKPEVLAEHVREAMGVMWQK